MAACSSRSGTTMSIRKRVKKVDLSWTPEAICAFCEKQDNWVLVLPDETSPAEIESLYRRQIRASRCYTGLIAEIAGHRNTPAAVRRDLFRRFRANVQVVAALATNPRLPARQLAQLARAADESVAEHARLRLKDRATDRK